MYDRITSGYFLGIIKLNIHQNTCRYLMNKCAIKIYSNLFTSSRNLFINLYLFKQ